MSGSVSGFIASNAPPGQQSQDTDGLVAFQVQTVGTTPQKVPVQLGPRQLLSSYAIPGAAIIGAGPGASRGLAGASVPAAGDPFVGYTLHATLQVVQPPVGSPVGTLAQIRVASGEPNTTVALDAGSNAAVPGQLNVGTNAPNSVGIISMGDGRVHLNATGLLLSSLPTTEPAPDPNGLAQLWNNGGILSVA